MLIHLHKQATTTPKVRAAIQASDEPASTLAERFGTTEQTVYIIRKLAMCAAGGYPESTGNHISGGEN